jgi:hypothetical protein
MQEIKGHELRFGRIAAGMKGEEIRDAVLAEDHGLAVDDRRAARSACSTSTMPGILSV